MSDKSQTGNIKVWNWYEIFGGRFAACFLWLDIRWKFANLMKIRSQEQWHDQISDKSHTSIIKVWEVSEIFRGLSAACFLLLDHRWKFGNLMKIKSQEQWQYQISDNSQTGSKKVWDLSEIFGSHFAASFLLLDHVLSFAGPTMKIRKSHKNQNSSNNDTTKYQTNLRLAI